ncbi:MAG: adenine deaminase [Prevotella sp.]
MKYTGHIVDVVRRRVFDGEVTVEDGVISSILPKSGVPHEAPYLMPGFIDSHVHIESSMMVPAEFARVAVEQGTVGVVADPHEIGNVLGKEGIDFMIANGSHIRFNFCFGAPSCVPSCDPAVETSGACLDSNDIREMMMRDDIGFLGEMMNYPGVLADDAEVKAKLEAAQRSGKPVDGHAPGLTGERRMKYAQAGIGTDHECSSLEEARACIEAGMIVQIREGSAAKNYGALIPLLKEYPDRIMFCTDDCHPDDLIRGHINRIVSRALADGYDLWDVLTATCVTPQRHYNLSWGLLQEGDAANFISVDNLTPHFRVLSTVVKGKEVYNCNSYLSTIQSQSKSISNQMAILDNYPNRFVAEPISADDISMTLNSGDTAHIVRAYDGSLLTGHDTVRVAGNPLIDMHYPWNEVQKIVVYNRYKKNAKPVVGLVRGFGIRNGAMAGSVAHDCHNIVAIGSSDEYIVKAVNRIIEMKGGEVAIAGEEMTDIALPIGGLISPLGGHEIAYRSSRLRDTVKRAGCMLKSPFITMAFMCLPVIPELKLTDRGLFDSVKWQFVE